MVGECGGGMGSESQGMFARPVGWEHQHELHGDRMAVEEKHGSQVVLIFRFLDHAFATGVLG
ncbi:hypothetical protein UQ03_19505 [Escherichia coli]|nr:hypothetical protein UQ03_19505 [Escherichia coli]